jgi:hypothetical protein
LCFFVTFYVAGRCQAPTHRQIRLPPQPLAHARRGCDQCRGHQRGGDAQQLPLRVFRNYDAAIAWLQDATAANLADAPKDDPEGAG